MVNHKRNEQSIKHQLRVERFWEHTFLKERSKLIRVLISALIGVVSFVWVWMMEGILPGLHFHGITIFTVIFVTLIGGLVTGLVITLGLTLVVDYFFTGPPRGVLSTPEEILNFVVIVTLGTVISFFLSSLRVFFHRTLAAKQEAEKAVQARDDMVGVISHELKNPLTALKTGILVIERVLEKECPAKALQQPLKGLVPSINRMSRLVADLLSVTSIEARALKVSLKSTDVSKIFSEVMKLYQPMASEKNIAMKSSVEPDCCDVFCDEERTIEILSNLVDNAIKFTNLGGLILISAKNFKDRVLVQVRDTGKGMSPECLPHVFDRFWQDKDTAYKGIGLGLPIAKGLVEAQGGQIWVESEPGTGTSFYFTLKMKEERQWAAA